MVRRVMRLVWSAGAVLIACTLSLAAVPLLAGPAQASATVAAPAKPPPKPTAITIEGPGLDAPLSVLAETDAELFSTLLGQVSWMAGGIGHAAAPRARRLGPKYTVVVMVKDRAVQTYDLYPLATGGPRAHRPAKQPDRRKATAAWFYGRLTMSEALRASGVPLPEKPDVVSGGLGGGIGGGGRIGDEDTFDPGRDLDKFFGDMRHVLLLNGAVVLVITLGLAGMSLLVRHRI